MFVSFMVLVQMKEEEREEASHRKSRRYGRKFARANRHHLHLRLLRTPAVMSRFDVLHCL